MNAVPKTDVVVNNWETGSAVLMSNATATIDTSTKGVEIVLPTKYIDPTRPVVVEFAANGTDFAKLPNASLIRQIPDEMFGAAFSLSPVSGTLMLFLPAYGEVGALTFAGDPASTACLSKVRVSCYVEMGQPRSTLGFVGNAGTGIEGLTDGRYNRLPGTKIAAALHPDGSDLLAENGVSTALAEASGFMHIVV